MAPVLAEGLHRHAWALFDILFPPSCISCGKRGNWICPACCAQFVPTVSACPVCARPQASMMVCAACLDSKHQLDGVSVAFRIDGPLRLAVHRFKYGNARVLARTLAEVIVERVSSPEHGSILVPVPLHPRHLRERGYNQSELLAGESACLLNQEIQVNALQRGVNTIPQARLSDATERRHNLSGTFSSPGSYFLGRSVIIVDEVCTTGATLTSCATALRQAGARTVSAIVLAREV